ncbi:MAG: bifunctional oligoribonuclease/PAP phosphatase NrnA [Crocinitomicaceae bacterium]|nr:bifunctional oligoribonuclease/PAP phosphatase NrnA [Flavobacteriales bacterium]NQZ35153.1 bifunctional oligoribonuclease/PAP phosphatase NrnA [Crocinitomicaceae bacterium]
MKLANEIVQSILDAEKIVITSHKSPDGDSIGSSLGMLRFIQALGKDAKICHPDSCPSFIEWLKDGVQIVDFDESQDRVISLMDEADLIFCLDYNGSNRLGKDMGGVLLAADAKKIMIDHHPYPEDIFHLSASHPEVCSTSQLVIELILKSGNENLLNQSIGTPLYLGIVTDTGSFRFSSVTSRTHELIGKLLENGVQQAEVHEKSFNHNRLDQMKLRGFAIAEKLEVMVDEELAIVSLSEVDLERFNYIKGDTEGLVNVALSIEGVSVAIMMTESDGKVKMSFRSMGSIVVNKFAGDHFDGGGHMNAAGGISFLSLEETIEKVKSLAPSYFGKTDA